MLYSLRQALLDASFPDDPPNLVFPPLHLCTDNAVMIAWAAMHRFAARDFETYDATIRPKWRIDDYTGKALARLQWVSGHPVPSYAARRMLTWCTIAEGAAKLPGAGRAEDREGAAQAPKRRGQLVPVLGLGLGVVSGLMVWMYLG